MEKEERLSQEQVFDIITGKDLSWQSIIYDLIKTEQLDPWDLDIGLLANRYLETIKMLEEHDFFISSKVLLACSLLLRLKSEILLNRYIRSLDEALFGRGDDERYEMEKIEIDEGELPQLIPKTPLARNRKVTLKELITALDKAINTETRRIKRQISESRVKRTMAQILPKKHVPLRVRIKNILGIITEHFREKSHPLLFSEFARSREEKLASFVPILHLSNAERIYLWQRKHFDEIHITTQMHDEERKAMEEELAHLIEQAS
ncbi:hypothetical protein D6829_02560 [Candidatus Pacearchaeota archaeon]|nr:MAG: hypothetical protein D6829_02560 [Candidatus Pacearchaeota archaeon]